MQQTPDDIVNTIIQEDPDAVMLSFLSGAHNTLCPVIMQKLKEKGIGVLITDHNVRDTLKITDKAFIINNGKIFASGTPDELATNEEVKKIYLGKDFKLY